MQYMIVLWCKKRFGDFPCHFLFGCKESIRQRTRARQHWALEYGDVLSQIGVPSFPQVIQMAGTSSSSATHTRWPSLSLQAPPSQHCSSSLPQDDSTGVGTGASAAESQPQVPSAGHRVMARSSDGMQPSPQQKKPSVQQFSPATAGSPHFPSVATRCLLQGGSPSTAQPWPLHSPVGWHERK